MKKLARLISVVLMYGTLLTACLPTASSTPSFGTVVAQTQAAMRTQLAIVSTITPFVPPTETPILPTFTPSPTNSAPTATPTAVTPTPAQAYCISSFSNVNIPNNTSMKGGSSFTKTWKLVNGGNFAWAADFKVVFVGGDSMNASPVELGRSVNPGSSINVSVDLIAPVASGDHQANFMLVTNKGDKFGIGPNCDRPFWVLINSSGLFKVTDAKVIADPSSYSGACPVTLQLTAVITANGVGTVTYVFRTSDGNTDTYAMDFADSGTITSKAIKWEVNSTTDLQVHIYISEPNHQDFGTITIPIVCTP